MGLRIGQLVTVCHVPPAHRERAEVVDRFARGRFARDLADRLGPSLSRQPAIVRLRGLSLRVIVPASDLNEDAISHAWTQAFMRALFTALTYPPGEGPIEVFRAETLASFIAGSIRSLLDGNTAPEWQYSEFEPFFRQGATAGPLALLCEWPAETVSVLLELSHAGVLDRLLPRFDEVALERIFLAAAGPEDAEPPPISIEQLVAAARLVRRFPPARARALATRQYALRLFVTARDVGEPVRAPRPLFHALLALSYLAMEAGSFSELQFDDIHSLTPRPEAVAALLRRIEEAVRSSSEASRLIQPRLAQLNEAVAEIRQQLQIQPRCHPEARWISTSSCGLFFLCQTLDRLGWVDEWHRIPEFRAGGPSPLLAGLALSIIGKFDPELQAPDPGLALFSGYLEEPDLAHLRAVLTAQGEAFFDQRADALIRAFALQIRGFRQASRASIVRSFIQTPGRIRVEERRIAVVPDSNPLHVALHIAGIDSPIESVSWLGGRRVEFEIGDL